MAKQPIHRRESASDGDKPQSKYHLLSSLHQILHPSFQAHYLVGLPYASIVSDVFPKSVVTI